ncbi:hypothetical protein B4U80_00331 [Leptotrombidium deliense]|uniref:DUF4211 domain-containing protein n=1 Tax=Leptotrombidium deliense TaxID=299467 RepID=A0A443SVD8_9ACAR|nr:hypothetical protein B4U80_00331 [Leptotrombidium deliense]
MNGVKPVKNNKSNNKCDVIEDRYEKQSKSLLNNNKVVDVKSGDSLKRTSEQSRDHEAKFFKVRPTLNTTNVCLTSQPTNNTNLQVVTKEKSRKRRSDEFSSKNTHDEYEFPDSPNPSANKKSKKIVSNETSVKKKVCEKLTVPTISTKKANNSTKSKLTVNATQTSTIKQQNNANCENMKNELKPPTNNLSVNINASINCNKTEVKKTEKHRHHDNSIVQKQEQIPSTKQKTSQAVVNQQTQLHQPNPQPQPIPPTPQLQQSLQSQLPTQPQFPAKIQIPPQQSKKNTTHENKNKKESSNTLLSNTPSHLVSKTSQSISVQSAGTNTPRRRSQDKKALTIREGLMRTGDFVVSLDEVTCELPMIWRIEGKSLLQRFEPSEQDSIIVYTNTSSYSAWNPTVRQRYTGVDVRIMGCSRTKVVVEKLGLTKTNPNNVNGETVPVERNKASTVGSTDQQQENFEVFIQTLVSQALDPNFIAEIVKENDDYFLSHVQAIDEFCSRKKSRFFSKVKWDANVVKCVETFPTFTVIPQNNVGDLRCRLCHDNWSTQILHFSGDPYDQMTLENKDPLDIKQTKYAACDVCKDRITLFSRLHHQKYSFYLKCREKVEEMRAGDENKESHIILEQCLQDTVWIQSLFKQLEKIWLDCDEMR